MLPNSMYALVLTPAGLQLDSEHPIPAPPPGEALLRIRLAGICSTDFQLTRGYKGGFQGVLGHEFVGEVVAAPSAPEWVGKRVVGDINVGCGQCDLCRRGLHKHCRHGNTLGINKRDGVFAEYATLPVANLYAVPDSVADDQAVFVEPLAAAFEILEQAAVTQTTRVYVQGDGRLGLLCALVLATTGCDLTVIGRNANKLAILKAAGIRNTVVSGTPAYENLFAQPADVVVEATGAMEGFHSALRLTRPMGTLVLKSTYADRLTDLRYQPPRRGRDHTCRQPLRALSARTGGVGKRRHRRATADPRALPAARRPCRLRPRPTQRRHQGSHRPDLLEHESSFSCFSVFLGVSRCSSVF